MFVNNTSMPMAEKVKDLLADRTLELESATEKQNKDRDDYNRFVEDVNTIKFTAVHKQCIRADIMSIV